jgi:two-component system chemotaxis response regulator CheY
MSRTILIVDDIAFVRRTLSEILIQAHYHIVGEASDGAEALQLYEQFHPDVVTMDIVMPQMSGIEAIRRITKIDKHAKIIVISAMGQDNLIMEAINAGAKDYISKPFTAVEVLKTLDRLFVDTTQSVNRTGLRDKV